MSHLNTRTPSGDDVTQRSDMKPAFSNDLFEHVLQEDNLSAAWKRVRANKGAAGIDGMTIDEFPAWVRSGNWKALKQQLVTGCYQPSPVRRVEIAKPDGGTRQLGIPTVTDRVIQQAIAQVLTPIFDPDFLNTVLDSVQVVMGSKRLSRYRASSRKDAASRWMLICRNSLTELITIY